MGLALVLHSLALFPGAGHILHLSFLLICEYSLRALGALCSEAFCLRKCSQSKGFITNSSLFVLAKIIKHFTPGIIAFCAYVSLPFAFSSDLGKGLQNHCQFIFGRFLLAFVCSSGYRWVLSSVRRLFVLCLGSLWCIMLQRSLVGLLLRVVFFFSRKRFHEMEKLQLLVIGNNFSCTEDFLSSLWGRKLGKGLAAESNACISCRYIFSPYYYVILMLVKSSFKVLLNPPNVLLITFRMNGS